jgi:hypothetical protein
MSIQLKRLSTTPLLDRPDISKHKFGDCPFSYWALDETELELPEDSASHDAGNCNVGYGIPSRIVRGWFVDEYRGKDAEADRHATYYISYQLISTWPQRSRPLAETHK